MKISFPMKLIGLFIASALLSVSSAYGQSNSSAQTLTIKVFSNLPDRNSNQGKLEQTLFDNYIKENPNVKIEVEALQDEPYKQKFKAYAVSNELPDLYMVYGFPAFFDPVMSGGFAQELNKDSYKDYGFFKGALDGFSHDGKLYGLPRNTDFYVLYYNKDLFRKNGIPLPASFEDLIKVSKAFRAQGIAPCAINGKDKWAIAMLFQDAVIKESGNQQLIYDAVKRRVKFSESPDIRKAAKDFKSLMDAKFFQDSFVAADYGAANNLFAQEKAAMYYMGSWEVGMKDNDSFSKSFRDNMAAMRFPAMKAGKGKDTDLLAYNGGGYAVSATSKNKDAAIQLLNYLMRPDNWAKNAWQSGLAVPGQNYAKFMTGKENELQRSLTNILSTATSQSGIDYLEVATPGFNTEGMDATQAFAVGILTPEKFLEALDKAADKAAKEMK
jgi:raffinose/stachyose/melibiose transport system substrate-binding protein